MTERAVQNFEVVVIGGGAAGLMCAIEAGKRGKTVLLLEKSDKVGKKILISGGGRCNFTNLFTAPDRYLSENKHFHKSAFKQYPQQRFIDLVEKHGIAYHEKKLGQLFCDNTASQITEMLLQECDAANVTVWCDAGAERIERLSLKGFSIRIGTEQVNASAVVIATGGLSIPKMGANDFAHRMASSFGLPLTPMKPGLVPFTFDAPDMQRFAGLSGVSADVVAKTGKTAFRENVLFTHRGVSGPAILQISSFWEDGKAIHLDFLPDEDLLSQLKSQRQENPKGSVIKFMNRYLASRLVEKLLEKTPSLPEFGNCSDKLLSQVTAAIKDVSITPNGTEGYRKAEVTVGGVSTACLNSKTMETKEVPGLYFVGEAVDVTGFLGGYNFQWAWSSGYVAGQNV
ncbi:NAD(P)/FAD-dependent oxidoreductase [Sneathiella sp.]|jgi:predicted Rossmann fold flavoprotein|uniref:NAD(P)/FAD-dependent oxidoreductase n=1 Tax=Sneathiella sp. TaxID=1964365 RepID=UPI0039E6912C